ncbi:MAG: hypothetical protein ACUVSA_08350 [Desulfosoma sp.]|uniref:hypothetical protein n=1 Tax=Desulfosoma sp. TaxID=2603217 RepID=UPI00404B434E
MECKLLHEEDASGDARKLYDEISAVYGMVPNFFKAQAAIDTSGLARTGNGHNTQC